MISSEDLGNKFSLNRKKLFTWVDLRPKAFWCVFVSPFWMLEELVLRIRDRPISVQGEESILRTHDFSTSKF